MARRFVRIDLTELSRNFQPLVVEPGLPMLDPAEANDKILHRWLGRMIAAPEWDGQSVNFFVRDDSGGRLEEVVCEPATRSDLTEFLGEELATLRQRLEQVRPATPTERAIHKAVSKAFRDLAEDPYRTDLDDYFFRYRDPNGRWRLVWCYGYQRTDQELAPAVICTDPDCNLLFLKRPGAKSKCPSCEALWLAMRAQRSPWRWLAAAALLLLLLLLGGGYYYWRLHPTELIATPGSWSGPAGSPIPFKIAENSLFRRGVDVSPQVAVEADDPAVARFDSSSRSLMAEKAGKTLVHFRLGRLTSAMPVEVKAVKAPSPPAPLPKSGEGSNSRVAAKPTGGPQAVKILSDQGPAVRIPVGVRFDDFRVVAEYPGGLTRVVTRKATYHMTQPADQAPAAADRGRLLGVRPGETVVQAEFDGVRTPQGLQVTVVPGLDVDELRVVPAKARILPGETVALDAIGLKNGKQVGHLTDLGTVVWQSSAAEILRSEGPSVTGLKEGAAEVTAQLGKLSSRPAVIAVVRSISEPLQLGPKALRLQVGESAVLGADLVVTRGTVDLSGQCTATPMQPAVVAYNPETHALVGKSPGTSAVEIAHGDQMATAMVEVVPATPIAGQILVEPAGATLAPGQEIELRVYTVDGAGNRVDRTALAEFVSSNPKTLFIDDRSACALLPGRVTVGAKLPGIDQPGAAEILVEDEQVTGLILDPAQIAMAVGDHARMRIMGRAPHGTYELFPQPDLKVAVGGPNPQAVKVVGTTGVDAMTPGQAQVTANWHGLSGNLPVSVAPNTFGGLRIDPAAFTIHPGDRLEYQLSSVAGGTRRPLGGKDGVKLTLANPSVARGLGGLIVQGVSPGQTAVVAEFRGERATGVLTVEPGRGAAVNYASGGRYVLDPYGHLVLPGYGVLGDGSGFASWGDWGWGLLDGLDRVVEGVATATPLGATGYTSAALQSIRVEPEHVGLQVGQVAPQFRVFARGQDGTEQEISATLQSMDPELLVPDPATPGHFIAKGLGGTQVRAVADGGEAFADVTISGKRFLAVDTKLNEGESDFSVAIEVQSDAAEGPLEYRVYPADAAPAGNWVPTVESAGATRQVHLVSPPLPYGSPSKRYHLIIEARDPAGKTLQAYPFTFRLRPDIQRTDDLRNKGN
jgi:hypothetical protein